MQPSQLTNIALIQHCEIILDVSELSKGQLKMSHKFQTYAGKNCSPLVIKSRKLKKFEVELCSTIDTAG